MGSVTVRIFKSYAAPSNRQWVNTYELNDGGAVVDPAVDPTTFRTAADTLVAAERVLHADSIYFNRMTISTWQPETGDYDPTDEVTVPLALQGQWAVISTAVPLIEDLRVVAWVARVAAAGRPGKIFYRGCLAETDIENQGGRWTLTPATGNISPTRFAAFKTALGTLIGGTPTGVRLVLIGGKLTKTVVDTTEGGMAHTKIKRTYGPPFHIRNVTDVVLQGAITRQTASAYFDRP